MVEWEEKFRPNNEAVPLIRVVLVICGLDQ